MFPPLLQSVTEPIDPLASDFHEEIPAYVNRILSIYPLYKEAKTGLCNFCIG